MTGADNGRHERANPQSPEQRIFLEVIWKNGSDVNSSIRRGLVEKYTTHAVSASAQ